MSSSTGDPAGFATVHVSPGGGGTSRRGRRHRRDPRLSLPALALVALSGGLAFWLRQPPAMDARTTAATDPGSSAASMAGPSAGSSSKPFAKPTARSSARATGAAASSVVTGKTVKTRFGDVQVRITVRARRIVAVREVKHTHAGTLSTKINKRALPVLYRETVQRQSARIDAVSGATVTSTGYLKSLQSAIDLAHLA